MFEQLLEKYLRETINPEELELFLSEAEKKENQEIIQEVLSAKLSAKAYNGFSDKEKLDAMFEAAMKKANGFREEHAVIPMQQKPDSKTIYRWVAAAIITLIATGAYFLFQSKQENTIAKVQKAEQINDIQPGGNRAILTLADGSQIILDSAHDGDLSQQGNTKVIKLNDGRLAYKNAGNNETAIVYNTISTPRGGTYQVILPDETKVWLNALSSLRFPTSFTGKQRNVEITGEAYFEVSKNKSMPFIVNANGMNVEVLGTHFNVMAYEDEGEQKTTLLEGSVKVNKNNKIVLLKPGQQAKLAKTNNDLNVANDVDVDEETAWRNGMFQFNNADIAEVMKQIARWYDVDVSYSGAKPTDHFTGKIPRNSSLSKVLKILELSDAHFRVEGKKIIVTS